MPAKTAESIDAEIEALKTRIRRLRLERKVAVLDECERELRRRARLAETTEFSIAECEAPL